MQSFLEELEEIAGKEDHLQTLDNLIIVYLCSEEANCQRDRSRTLLLFLKLRQLFL